MKNMLPVKAFQETLHEGMCGPACMKMILDYYGIEKQETEIAKLCGTEKFLGTNAETLICIAENFGLKTTLKNNSLFADIQGWLDQKVPVIVNWFSRGRSDYPDSAVADGHYSIAVGLDEKHIYLQDPEIGKLRTLLHDDFYKVWFDFKGEAINTWDDMIIRQIIAVYK